MNDFGRGHNNPPPDPFDRADELVANANKWIKERPEITDEEQAGACQLAIDQLNKAKEDLEADWKARREPHDLAIAALRIQFRDPLELIGIAKTRLQEIAGAWLSKKRERLKIEKEERERAAKVAEAELHAIQTLRPEVPTSVEAELAERRAAEEALRTTKAAAKAARRAQIKGDYAGRAMSLRENWKAEITDRKAALRHYGKDEDVLAAAAVKALQKAGDLARETKREDAAPPGFRFFKTEKAV